MKRAYLIIFFLCVLCVLSSCGHEHTFSEWRVKTEATCSAEGEKVRMCECGETESAVIEKKEHQIITISPIAPTCTDIGYTEGRCCSVCGHFTAEPQPIQPSHVFTPATCTEPTTCSVCNVSVGEPLGHTLKLGICERCENFVQPKITLPSLPVSASVETEGYKTEMSITAISYTFTGNSIAFTYSGIKTKDEGSLTDGRYFCGFSYRLYDSEGNLAASGNTSVFNLAVGESFKEERFFIISLPEISDFYTLVIEDFDENNN